MKKFVFISMVLICLISIYLLSNVDSDNNNINIVIKASNIINVNYYYIFCILELLLLCMMSSFKKMDFKYYIISLIFCLLYDCIDEVHQFISNGNNIQIMNISIKFSFSVIGCIIFKWFYYIFYEGLKEE